MAHATDRLDALAEAWELLQRLVAGEKGCVADLAAEAGLAPQQLAALVALDPADPRPMSGLAHAMRCDNSNVTAIVDRLEACGLVRRRPGERDRRVKMLEVTPEGAAVRDRIRRRLAAPPAPLAALDAQDAVALRDILRRAVSSAST